MWTELLQQGWPLLVVRIWIVLAMAPLWRSACGWWWWPLSGAMAVVAVWIGTTAGEHLVVAQWLVGASERAWFLALALEIAVAAVVGRVLGLGGALLLGAVAQIEERMVGTSTLGPRLWATVACLVGLGAGVHHHAWPLLRAWLELAPIGEPWKLVPAPSLASVVDLGQGGVGLALALVSPVWLTSSVVDLVHAVCWPRADMTSPWRITGRVVAGMIAWWSAWWLAPMATFARWHG